MAGEHVGPDQRRKRAQVVVAAVALVLLVGGLVVVVRLSAEPAQSPQTAAPPVATTSPATLTTPESDLQWIDRQGVALPVSRTAGPKAVRDGRAWGFAPSQLGAVLAAAYITWQAGATGGPDVYELTISEQVTGPAARALRAATHAEYNRRRSQLGVRAGAPLGRGYAEMLGYRVEAFHKGESAVVHLLMAGPSVDGQPSTYDFRTTLIWENGDWKLQAPPGGRWESVTTPVPANAPGYIVLRKDS